MNRQVQGAIGCLLFIALFLTLGPQVAFGFAGGWLLAYVLVAAQQVLEIRRRP